MKYTLNLPTSFAVPCDITDTHLKLARELELKVLLWLLRHNGTRELSELADFLKKPEQELADALQVWVNRGVLKIAEPVALSATPPALSTKHLAPSTTPARPSQQQILTRIGEDDNLRALFAEADKLLGRTLGYDGQCTLLMLHDHHGLSCEVIPMLLHYAKQVGKTNTAYWQAVGSDWAQRGIATLEQAAEQIEQLNANFGLWNALKARTGIAAPRPTDKQHAMLRKWTSDWKFGLDMIVAAYDEAAERTGKVSFSYMNKVLENWHAAGITTPEQAAAEQAKFTQARKPKPKPGKQALQSDGFAPSFDLDAFEKSLL
ncbi:MAG: DnaD domain protein [Oscillospiraceae bacterium]|jgi:DnaD/phage-associated family protein|nr:DnaD domain protein [Oscillospiraceae bacterium]